MLMASSLLEYDYDNYDNYDMYILGIGENGEIYLPLSKIIIVFFFKRERSDTNHLGLA